MPKTLRPGSDRVVVAFLKTLTGKAYIATSLPSDSSTWVSTGFIQVQTVGGTPHRDLPQQQPVLRIDVWATNGSSSKAPFGMAERISEEIRQPLTSGPTFFNKKVALGDDFKDAIVLSAWPVSEPRRVEGDESSYARFTFDIQVNWTVVP